MSDTSREIEVCTRRVIWVIIFGLAAVLACAWWTSPSRRVRALIDEAKEPRVSHDILSWRRSYAEIESDFRKLGPKAVPPLIRMLKDPDIRRRQLAAQQLGRLGDRRAVPDLQVLLDGADADPRHLTRERSAEALGNLGDPSALPCLLRNAVDPQEEVRAAVMEALGKLGDRSVVPVLIAAVSSDGSGRVRMYAAQSLGRLNDPQAVPALRRALEDDSMIARPAAIALAQSGYADGFPHLLEELKLTDGMRGADYRAEMVRLIGSLNDPRADAALAEIARSDRNPEIRKQAADIQEARRKK